MYTDINLKDTNNPSEKPVQPYRIHPHKFTLWVAIGSIIMMFAGLTSAYIVKSGQAGWQEVKTPVIFWFSTAVLLISSVTIQSSLRAFKQKEMRQFRLLFLITLILGIAFVILQWTGFNYLWNKGIHFDGSGAAQFLYIIFGLHALHVLGGIIAMVIISIQQYFSNNRSYNSVPVEVMTTYWHFVDILWIYLLTFFIWIG
ncbi:MAG TPA: heme-copper oxidase subunit III [Flavisolibacter sp.]|jgi:cytochrome c oxidase subunit 3|nr:heme-copper oxidase subunit III [Flavisolibacter sp.]